MRALDNLAQSSDLTTQLRSWGRQLDESLLGGGDYARDLKFITQAHLNRLTETTQANLDRNLAAWTKVGNAMTRLTLAQDWLDYLTDSAQRSVLFLDAMRERGNHFAEHEDGGNKTVLSWEHDVILDGATLARPVNYSLVRILPPAGVSVREDGRPYVIIDPRAGHGSGIGGFKHESEVGAAIHQGHPTYFLTFTRLPVPGQTLADVTAAEADFVREVRRRHPRSPKPVIIGNCQGGWASMLLAATNPDITGPVVANGAPLSYWAGQKGKNPMRYLGGLVGGGLIVRFLSDIGNGRFDGAHLVFNFERLSPSNTWWEKYYNLWKDIDKEAPRFVGFERWWGSFFYMTPEEIGWIVDNLFVGNRLGRGCANLNERTHVDLREIKSPVIVFASHGDNITPPQQALGWIADHYRDAEEIRARGQRIVYTLHENVGHLGIFVSSSVAKKEHEQIVSTLKAIEALAPGLYEMMITEVQGEGVDKRFRVAFAERSIADVIAECGGDDSDRPFAAVARFSELGTQFYDLTMRPLVSALANETSAAILANAHPARLQRWMHSNRNPLMAPVRATAEEVRRVRRPASPENPFRMMEQFGADLLTQGWDLIRDTQNALIEWNFHLLWGAPSVQRLGDAMGGTISEAPREDLRTLTSVQDALDRIEQGGFADGVVRMLIFLAQSRKEVRRSRLERSNQMMSTIEPFASMTPKAKTRLIHKESLIVGYEPEDALTALPKLLPTHAERHRALDICEEIAGPSDEMSVETQQMLAQLRAILDQAETVPGPDPGAMLRIA